MQEFARKLILKWPIRFVCDPREVFVLIGNNTDGQWLFKTVISYAEMGIRWSTLETLRRRVPPRLKKNPV